MLALVLAAVLTADHQYIIPLIGASSGVGTTHFATGTMLNPTARTATVRRTGLFPPQCTRMTESWQLPPHSSVEIAFPYDSNCHGGMAAMTIVSDEPLHVTGSILTWGFMPHWIMDAQEYDAPSAWIEAGTEAATSAVIYEHGAQRANLLVINPDAERLQVEARLYRPELDASRTDTFEVPPASVRIFPLAAVADPQPPSPFPRGIDGRHEIVVRANGRFWAGASSFNTIGGNVFRKAIPLEP